jgi:hypothetical protein
MQANTSAAFSSRVKGFAWRSDNWIDYSNLRFG